MATLEENKAEEKVNPETTNEANESKETENSKEEKTAERAQEENNSPEAESNGEAVAEEAAAPVKNGLPVHLQPKMGYPSTAVPELIRLRETERSLRHRLRKAPNKKAVSDVRAYFDLFVEHVESVISDAEKALKESK